MGWQEATLGELGRVSMCKRILKDQTLPVGEIPFYKIGTFGKTANAFIPTELFEEYKARFSFPKVGDILISASGTIGRCVVYDGKPAYFQDSNIVWIDNDEELVSNEYLLHFYRACNWNPSRGATISRLYNDDLRKIKISFPSSIPEQQRLVAILDQAFADIEKARANAEQNLKNALELFDSYLNQVFSQSGEGWVEEVLGSVCDVRDGTHDSPKYVDEGIPFITQKNIRTDGLSFEKTKFISETDHMKFYKRSNVTHGDILISMIGVNRGMACVVDDNRIFSIKNVGLIKKALNINSFFLLFYLKSHAAKKYIESESRGGAQPFIGLTKLRVFPVLLASPEEQEEVVSKLTLIETRTKNLVSIYEAKLNSLDELKKSLLQKAFSGELTKGEGRAA